MFTLVILGIAVFTAFALFLCLIVAIKMFYRVPRADEAFVKTGGREPVVSVGRGLWVIPFYNKVAMVSLRAVRIPIERVGTDAVPTADKLMAEMVGELFIRVDPINRDHVILAAQALGEVDLEDVDAYIKQQVDSMVTDALRTAAFKRTFLGLNSEKKEFADDVTILLQEDLGKLGLTLTAVTIPSIRQGEFTADIGDVLAAEGRRNVAEATAKARQETNQITREAEVRIQQQDVNAREQALTLELKRKQLEAVQAKQVAEYEQNQQTETRKIVLTQEEAREVANAQQKKAVETAQIEQAQMVEEAKIKRTQSLGIANALAQSAQKKAEETSTQAMLTAEIERQQAVETAEISKERSLKVADESRQQAIAEAEIGKQVAIATKKSEEAAARAQQAEAEAKQRFAEEAVVTVKAEAEADRQKRVTVVKAGEEAEKQKIAADRDAYVQAKKAEGERDAAMKRAESVKAEAEGGAQAAKAQAQGRADAVLIEATASADSRKVRAEAEQEAASKEAEARIKIANAILEEGKAKAESERLLVEAKNQVSQNIVMRDVALAAIQQAPAVVHEIMQPITKVSDVKVVQISGMGGEGSSSVPGTILGAGLAASGFLPILREAMSGLKSNEDVQALAKDATGMVKTALKTFTDQPSNGA